MESAKRCHVSQTTMQTCLDAVLECMKEALKNGDDIKINKNFRNLHRQTTQRT